MKLLFFDINKFCWLKHGTQDYIPGPRDDPEACQRGAEQRRLHYPQFRITPSVRKVFLHKRHLTPNVVFLSLNINMGSAIPRAKMRKIVRIWLQFSRSPGQLGPPYFAGT